MESQNPKDLDWIIRECGWENQPLAESEQLAPRIDLVLAKKVIDHLQVFTPEMMKEHAGDISDERWRFGKCAVILLGRSPRVSNEWLMNQMAGVYPYTADVIKRALRLRQGLE